ncbi:hypothetical protein PESHB4_19620 [Pediococcus ethanolidurans]|uniref:Uncharacterized protein n=1 Tax=Pediococcus ethanolidurans TaxID=319653 RepID=A0A1H9TC58_9LACO|nr:hypothetical protein PET01_20590 [Pediococcus ethanolidurans]SER94534.1 hypothetical protein SAMN04487973_13113 [Pediococcus ethanolidurans]
MLANKTKINCLARHLNWYDEKYIYSKKYRNYCVFDFNLGWAFRWQWCFINFIKGDFNVIYYF